MCAGWSRLRSDLSRGGGQGNNRPDGQGLQVFIDSGSGFAAFGDRPYDERLAAAHVAGGEDSGNRRHIVLVGGDVAAIVKLNSELLDHAVADGTEESHGDEDQVSVHRELGARDGLELRGRANPNGMKLAD